MAVEERVANLLGEGQRRAAAMLAVESYGPEVLGSSIVKRCRRTTTRRSRFESTRISARNEAAQIFCDEDPTEEKLTRVSARPRKQLQFVKDEIRLRAREAGLLPDHES